MSAEILDAIEEIHLENELLKNPKMVSFLWFFYGISCLIWGVYWIFSYSMPYINWFTMSPINYQYEIIITGIFNLFIANKIHLRKKNVFKLLSLLCLISFLFFVISTIYYWNIWSEPEISFFISSGFNPTFISTILITIFTYKNAISKFTLATLFFLPKQYWILLIISSFPILLSLVVDYTFFEFLHFYYLPANIQ
jgi:hypothetical protein